MCLATGHRTKSEAGNHNGGERIPVSDAPSPPQGSGISGPAPHTCAAYTRRTRASDLMKPSAMLRCTHVDDAKLLLSRKRFTIGYPPRSVLLLAYRESYMRKNPTANVLHAPSELRRQEWQQVCGVELK